MIRIPLRRLTESLKPSTYFCLQLDGHPNHVKPNFARPGGARMAAQEEPAARNTEQRRAAGRQKRQAISGGEQMEGVAAFASMAPCGGPLLCHDTWQWFRHMAATRTLSCLL